MDSNSPPVARLSFVRIGFCVLLIAVAAAFVLPYPIFTEIGNQISRIPDTLWSAVLASGLTLTGVHMSNRSSDAQLRIRLLHEKESQQIERQMTMRREAYLDGVSHLAIALNSLPAFSHQEFDNKNLQERLMLGTASYARIHVLAGPALTKAMHAASNRLGQAVLDGFERRGPLQEMLNRRGVLDKLLQTLNTERERWFHELRQLNLDAAPDPHRANETHRMLEEIKNRGEAIFEELESLTPKIHAEQQKIATAAVEDMFEGSQLGLTLLHEIRLELGFDSDISEYADIMQSSLDLQNAMWARFKQTAEAATPSVDLSAPPPKNNSLP